MERKGTSTSNFGVGKRESHDASGFYDRFERPLLSSDATVPEPREIPEPFVLGDSTDMSALHDGEVALVVTSPPYFAGKQYEEELERDGVPSSYGEYLDMLTAVFAECRRVLEPGGRIAVNVANLGRKPYRNLAADVTDILQRLGLLLRGEVVWQKGDGASGSCAWGSYRSPANPVLRDMTERVVIASKGRFDRAVTARDRAKRGLPHEITISADEFMAATLDVWEIPPESARRVNHPAPFPSALPERLIGLYTYRNDLVIDPFMGSGSTLVAASRTGRRYLGYDLDPAYLEIARERVAAEGAPLPPPVTDGRSAGALAAEELERAGFRIVGRDRRIARASLTVAFSVEDAMGRPWLVEVAGSDTATGGGLARAETAWRTVGRGAAIAANAGEARLLVLSPSLPKPGSEGDAALRSVGTSVFFDVIALGRDDDRARLRHYAAGASAPVAGFWRPRDLGDVVASRATARSKTGPKKG